jgi:5-(carboxyamino)imidazole ribonucleotide synthase
MVVEPDPQAPAGAVADVHLVAAYDDPDALAHLARECAVVTTEFENPPLAVLEELARHTIVRPSPAAVGVAQDRRAEKRFLNRAGFPVAPFTVIERDDDLDVDAEFFPAILKTARLGYDGKGQVAVPNAGELGAAWAELGCAPCVLEQRLALQGELSVVLARGVDGTAAAFAPTANTHRNGILDLSVAPATGPLAAAATALAAQVAEVLDYVGVLGVELFVVDGELIVNELAPRPHNSGHWTLDGARTSQFEQQVRAVCGLTLGDPAMTHGGVAMVNLLGERWERGEPDWAAALADPGAHLHLYGKHEPRPGRKMGHLTTLAASPEQAEALALHLRARCARDEE